MSWEKGNQTKRLNFACGDFNKGLLENEEYLSQDEAKVALYKFLRKNPGYAAQLILGVRLYPFQYIAIKGMCISDYSMYVLSRGASKCSVENEIVFTGSGMKKVIDVEVGDQIQSLYGNNKVLSKTINNSQPIWEVHTKSGYHAGGLDYHRSLTFNPETLEYDWKFAQDIRVGDTIPIRKGFEFWPEEKNILLDAPKTTGRFAFDAQKRSLNDWYYFWGLLIGDGHYTGGKGDKSGVGLTTNDKEIAIWANNFVCDVMLKDRQAPIRNGDNLYSIRLIRKEFLVWMESLGFDPNHLAYQRSIPDKLLTNSKENIAALLSGLYDTDGYVSVRRNPRKRAVMTRVGFTSSSETLISQVQNLLLNFGMASGTHVTFKGGGSTFGDGKVHQCRKAWSIVLHNSSSTRAFAEKIGFRLGRKKEKLDQGFSEQIHGDLDYGSQIPCQKYIESKYGRYHNKNGDTVKLSYGGKSLSRPKLQRLYNMGVFDEIDQPKIKKILDLDIYYDTVKEVKNEEAVTVDIQVEKEECYYSNGFISHNTFSCAVYCLLECILNPNSNIGVISSSFRQCLVGDSLILTTDGYKKIKDLEIGDLVKSINGVNEVLDKWKNKPSKTLKIETKRGFKIEGKYGHKIFAYNSGTHSHEWKKIEDLKIGDHLPIQRGNNIWGKNGLDKDTAYIYGLALGDGHVSENNRITITSNDSETLEFLKSYGFRIFPKTCSNCSYARNSYNDFKSNESFLCKKTATFKYIPQAILESNEETVTNFLSGLFDSDGYCNPRAEIALATSSKKIAKQVQLLLLNLGIISNISVDKARGEISICGNKCIGREAYKVRITNKENIDLFIEKIGFRLTRKQEKAKKLASSAQWSCYDVVPNLQHGIRERHKKCVKGGNLQKCWGGMSFKRIKSFLENNPNIQDEELTDILNKHYYYDPVVSIKEGEGVTYDITVNKEHNYHANGFINHNSKLIMSKMEDILNKPGARLARDCIGDSGRSIKKGTDQWELQIGNSRVIALPLANGERLRGFRFTQIVLDEFLNIPEKIFNEVIMPFLGVVPNPTEREDIDKLENLLIERGRMTREEKMVWPNNKLILLSSPSFKFEYMYKLYKQYVSLISGEDISQNLMEEGAIQPNTEAHRFVMQLSYDCVPPGLYDQNLLNQAKATMSEMQFKREFGAQFVDESDGYYRLSKMQACTVEDGFMPAVEIKGNKSDEYLLSFDPSWAGNSSADHFAMNIYKISKTDQKLYYVHSYAVAGVDLKKHQRYFLYLLQNFNIVGMCGDYNGGLQFIEAWNESQTAKENGLTIGVLDVKFDDPVEYEEDLRELKRQYDKSRRMYCFLRKPSSTWIREANERLQADIDHRRIIFAAKAVDNHFEDQIAQDIKVEELQWDITTPKSETRAKMIDFIEFVKDNIEMTKNQCANIEIKTNPQGSQTFDLPQHLKRSTAPDRARKDSYSALVLGNWFGRIYFDMIYLKKGPEIQATFTPMIIR